MELKKSAASGIDGKSACGYETNLQENINDLHTRVRNKSYKAPNIRRVWIDKGGGKQRPLGISTVEDKIVQRTVSDILNLIYEIMLGLLSSMYQSCLCAWFKWLNRRGQRKSYTWQGFYELLKHFTLPKPEIVHYNV